MNRHLIDTAISLITIFAVILLWCVASYSWNVPSYILPTPVSVLSALKVGYIDGLYYPHFFFTLTTMVLGYAAGCTLAFILGAAVAQWRVVDRAVYPLVITLQSMPKVALAPLLLVWFGFGIESKIVMVALICFFPIFVNTSVGLRQANPELINLMRAFSASEWMVFRKIKLPAAAGHIFAGLQIAVVLSLIGAVVAEFVSSSKGLGHLISASSVSLEVNVMFAALISLAVIGITANQIVRYLHRKLVFWEQHDASNSSSVTAVS